MTRDADVSDFVARDDDENPLTVSDTIELEDDTIEVEFIPATKGIMNELDSMEAEDIEDKGIPKVLERYRKPDFRNEDGDIEESVVDNIPIPRLNKLFDTFLTGSGVDEEAIENPEEYVEGNLAEMDKQERAREMRSQG
jgi:hypothetical protein